MTDAVTASKGAPGGAGELPLIPMSKPALSKPKPEGIVVASMLAYVVNFAFVICGNLWNNPS